MAPAVAPGMDAMDAVALGARVQQVADKLLLKAEEARAKGNAGAAHALAESVSDLRHAAAVLVEQKRLLTVRQAEAASAAGPPASSSGGDASARTRLRRNSSASSIVSMMSTYDVASVAGSVHSQYHPHGYPSNPPHTSSHSSFPSLPQQQQQQQELVARLARVEKMLGKKSDEMKAKGNDNASHALHQSALYVRAGSTYINEQQLQSSALAMRYDALQAQWQSLTAVLANASASANTSSEPTEVTDDSDTAITHATALVAALATMQRERDAATSDRVRLEAQVIELKRLHAEENLLLREDIALVQRDKQATKDANASTCAMLHAALETATEAQTQLTAQLASCTAETATLEQEVENWRERWQNETEEWTMRFAAAEATHATQLAALQEQVMTSAAAVASVSTRRSNDAHDENETTTSEEDDAVAALERERKELQALVDANNQQLTNERARIVAIEQQHANAIDALAVEHTQQIDALAADLTAATAATHELRNQLAVEAANNATLVQTTQRLELEALVAQTQLSELNEQQLTAAAALATVQRDVAALCTSLTAVDTASAAASSLEALAIEESSVRDVQRALASLLLRINNSDNKRFERLASHTQILQAFVHDCEQLWPQASTGEAVTVATTDDDVDTGERLTRVRLQLEQFASDHNTLQQTLALERKNAQTLAAENAALGSKLEELQSHTNDCNAATADAHDRAVQELQAALDSVNSEFDRYRLRSHTALKKLEKRAALLNAMRKENEELTQALTTREGAATNAAAQIEALQAQLTEATAAALMLQEELTQRLVVNERTRLDAERQRVAAEQALGELRQERDAREQQTAHEHDALAATLAAERDALVMELAAATQQTNELTRKLQACDEATDTKTALVQLQQQLDAAATQMRDDAVRIADLESQLHAVASKAPPAPPTNADVRDDAIRELRRQLRELQDRIHGYEEADAATELERERVALADVQAARASRQRAHELALQLKDRRALVTTFEAQVHAVVLELTSGLDDHAQLFRDACAFRDAHRARLVAVEETALNEEVDSSASGDAVAIVNALPPAYIECLVMHSGVVIKAGAQFALPVVCGARGWRINWTFAVKEDDAADVGFTLTVVRPTDASRIVVVAPQRVHALSGTFDVDAASDGATLVFEWDNAFSWLNEKTLDYHVSVHEPVSAPAVAVVDLPQLQQQPQAPERKRLPSLSLSATQLHDGLAVLAAEATSRAALANAVARLHALEQAKEAHVMAFDARAEELVDRKRALQLEMDELKTTLSELISEQDELADARVALLKSWRAAVSERDDAETTVQFADASQLDALALVLQQQQQQQEIKEVEEEDAREAQAVERG